MGLLSILLGLIVLVVTWWDYHREEADTILLFDWIWWWDFRRDEYPAVFWALILGQACMGIGLALYGLFELIFPH